MATKELVDRAMAAFDRLDAFGKGLTARLYGVKAKEGSDGMRAAFTRSSDAQAEETADDLEYELSQAGRDDPPGYFEHPKA